MTPRTVLGLDHGLSRVKRRFFALAALVALAACAEAPTDPTTASVVAATAAFNHLPTHQVFESGTNVQAYAPIVPASGNPNWVNAICGGKYNTTNPPAPAYGLTHAAWGTATFNSFVPTTYQGSPHGGHPWRGIVGTPWINAWNDLESRGAAPYYQSWTRYEMPVQGNGSFVLKLIADNCSWIYIDNSLVGFQPVGGEEAGHHSTYGLTLNGTHKLTFIIFDGGGAAGGNFSLETTTNPPPPLNPDLDGDGVPNTTDKFPLDPTESADSDNDGVGDNGDNCPSVSNAGQTDTDGDGVGDPCDPTPLGDSDGDGVGDGHDNCPSVVNPDQADLDGDGVGDRCDPDIDDDGVRNENDAYPFDPNRSSFDVDGDGVNDENDNCPTDPNGSQSDQDNDGAGDACDGDIDGDGVANESDAFPTNPNESADSDGDGVGNNSDAFPNNPNETVDTDGDGVGNNGDNCRTISNADQANLDGDSMGDACDPDVDGDGVANGSDAFPRNPAEWTDSDGDGVGNNADPYDNSNTGPALMVGSCNPGVGNWRISGGTYANDLIAAAYASAPNHGAFVSAVSELSNGWKKAGKISGREHGAIVSCAARTK